MSFSNRLGDLGRREEALAAIEEAVTIRRQLAGARPDAFLPDLAMALNNQSIRVGDPGRQVEALAAVEEAVTIYRQLAGARPAAFLADLTTCYTTSQTYCHCSIEVQRRRRFGMKLAQPEAQQFRHQQKVLMIMPMCNLLTRRSMESVRPVRRNPNPHVSVLLGVRHGRHSPAPSGQSVRKL